MITSIIPASIVATISPSVPYSATIPYMMTTNAAVGPPICTRLPPKNEMKKPAIIAVYSPCSGPTPEAIASAIDSGSAMMATMIPAMISFISCAFE